MLGFSLVATVLVAYAIGWLAGVRSPVVLPLVALAAPALLLAIFVAGSCLIAGTFSLRTFAGEYLSVARIMLVTMPWSPGPVRHGAAGPPVLLVHGFFCNRGAFLIMARRLALEGYAACSHDLEPVYSSIDDYVPALAAKIDSLVAENGGKPIPVVCHSMGGLAVRAYCRRHGNAKVSHLVTLGTPHAGTRLADWGAGTNVAQMRPGSAWLEALAAHERTAGRVPMTAIWSTADNIVAPQDSAAPAGADFVRFNALGHVELLFDDGVFAELVQRLKGSRAL
jgi:triacylglycerol esterase/lipase EstA (alpha/beta hydrolase family)